MAQHRPKPRRISDHPPGAPQPLGPLQDHEPVRLGVVMAGRQNVETTLVRASGESPVAVAVAVGRVRLVFTERAAIEMVAARWAEMAGLAGHLPAEFERSTPAAAVVPTAVSSAVSSVESTSTAGQAVVVRIGEKALVTGRVVRPQGYTNWLQLQVGPVQFSIRDTSAFHTAAAGLRSAAKLATIGLVESSPSAAVTAAPSPREVAARSVASALAAPPAEGSASSAGARLGQATPAAPVSAASPTRLRSVPTSKPGAAAGGGCGR